MKKAFLIVPPTDLWVREDRCQGPIRQNLVKVIRPPIRLGQAGAILEGAGYECKLVDYPAESKLWDDFKIDLELFNPDIVFISTVFKTRDDDFKACVIAKKYNPEIRTIMKGAPLGDDLEALEKCLELDV